LRAHFFEGGDLDIKNLARSGEVTHRRRLPSKGMNFNREERA
jgi:hypothetical protein